MDGEHLGLSDEHGQEDSRVHRNDISKSFVEVRRANGIGLQLHWKARRQAGLDLQDSLENVVSIAQAILGRALPVAIPFHHIAIQVRPTPASIDPCLCCRPRSLHRTWSSGPLDQIPINGKRPSGTALG